MPARISAWAIYDQFITADQETVFLGITSDNHWQRFCDRFELPDLFADENLSSNNQRIEARPRLLPVIRDIIAAMDLAEVSEKALLAALPFAHVARPEQLFDDPHLTAGGYLLDTEMQDGNHAGLPALPMTFGTRMMQLRNSPPHLGVDTAACLAEIGFCDDAIKALHKDGVINLGDNQMTEEQ